MSTRKREDYLALPVVKSKERTMVMLECGSEDWDFHGEYRKELIQFLNELGFDAKFKYKATDIIQIDGIEVDGDFSQAATMGTHAFTRVKSKRKIRRIILRVNWEDALCTIPINKPIDKLRLVEKIKAGIKEKADRKANHENSTKLKTEVLTALFKKYKAGVTGLKNLKTEKGMLTVCFEHGTLRIDGAGKVIGCDINTPKVETLQALNSLTSTIATIKENVEKVIMEIETLGATGVTESTPDGSVWQYEKKITVS